MQGLEDWLQDPNVPKGTKNKKSVSKLKAAIYEFIFGQKQLHTEDVTLTNLRQKNACQKAFNSIKNTINSLNKLKY